MHRNEDNGNAVSLNPYEFPFLFGVSLKLISTTNNNLPECSAFSVQSCHAFHLEHISQ